MLSFFSVSPKQVLQSLYIRVTKPISSDFSHLLPVFEISIDKKVYQRLDDLGIIPEKTLQDLNLAVLHSLYDKNKDTPFIANLALKIYQFKGIAFTKGTKHVKEIHISSSYLENISDDEKFYTEFHGILTHELVHVWQYDGAGTAPFGWIEGLADFIRLQKGFIPSHWREPKRKQDFPNTWDCGYEKTGYFLNFVERMQPGFIKLMNRSLSKQRWKDTLFENFTGLNIAKLFELYIQESEKETLP